MDSVRGLSQVFEDFERRFLLRALTYLRALDLPQVARHPSGNSVALAMGGNLCASGPSSNEVECAMSLDGSVRCLRGGACRPAARDSLPQLFALRLCRATKSLKSDLSHAVARMARALLDSGESGAAEGPPYSWRVFG